MTIIRQISALLLVLFFALPQSLAAEPTGPVLWSIEDDDTTIYIFGTIHLMNAGVDWNTDKVRAAFEGADTLVLELGPDQLNPALLQPLIVKHALFSQGTKLPDVVSTETYRKVRAQLQRLGAPNNSLDNMKPWMVASFLAVQIAQADGFLPGLGVDVTLMANAVETGKEIRGLETADFQFGIFSGLEIDTQVIFLEETLDQVENLKPFFENLRDAWLAGDLDTLDRQLNADWENYPALREAILDNRNRNWVGDLEGLLAVPGNLFVAVGTGHLVGNNNVIELLEAAGHEVKLH